MRITGSVFVSISVASPPMGDHTMTGESGKGKTRSTQGQPEGGALSDPYRFTGPCEARRLQSGTPPEARRHPGINRSIPPAICPSFYPGNSLSCIRAISHRRCEKYLASQRTLSADRGLGGRAMRKPALGLLPNQTVVNPGAQREGAKHQTRPPSPCFIVLSMISVPQKGPRTHAMSPPWQG